MGATLRVFGQYIVTICNSKNRVEADEACDEEIPKAEDSVHKASFIHRFSSRVDMEGWKFAKGTTLKKVLPMKQFKGVITPSRNVWSAPYLLLFGNECCCWQECAGALLDLT